MFEAVNSERSVQSTLVMIQVVAPTFVIWTRTLARSFSANVRVSVALPKLPR